MYPSFNKTYGFNEDLDCAVELLKIFVELLNKYKIDYFIISGTLLGFVKFNGFIPWDDDIDLIVDSEQYLSNINSIINDTSNNFITHCCVEKYFYKFCYKDKINKFSEGYNFPFIDVFTYTINDDKLNFFKKNWDKCNFYPKQLGRFYNIDVFIPNNPDYFLTINYGANYLKNHKSGKWSHRYEKTLNMPAVVISVEEYNKFIEHQNNK